MAHINLLPHRAARRKQREREFFMQLVVTVGAGIGFLVLWGLWMGARIDNQNDRNSMMQSEIQQVDARIAKIKDLEKVRDHLLARKQVIEELQADRAKMVHLFDELVRTIPPSVRLKGLKQDANSLSLDGLAQSNASVAEYLRNIEASPWMGHTDLRKTEKSADINNSRLPYTFAVDVALISPKNDVALAGVAAPAHAGSAAAPAAPATPVGKPSAAAGGVKP